MKTTVRSVEALAEAGLVDRQALGALAEVARRYAVAITPALVERIDPVDSADPVALQFVPDAREAVTLDIERADPIGDAAHSPVPGIVHRYRDRALLKLHHACAVYCRFCFRREMVGPGGDALDEAGLEAALGYIADHTELFEVILTGGDPLAASPRRIEHVMRRLGSIDHLGIVRLHSRVPVADPDRITPEMIAALKAGKPAWLAVHVNHAQELGAPARAAIGRLVDAGIPLVSQTVLLEGVNADPQTLDALFRELLKLRVKPYYLHHGDLAPGTSHFRTTIARGQEIMRELGTRLSGLGRPAYMLDIPGGHGKVPVGPTYLCEDAEGMTVQDPGGTLHRYPPREPLPNP